MNKVSVLAMAAVMGLGFRGAALADPITYDFTTIDGPGFANTVLYGINNSQQILGVANDGSGAGSFVYTDGSFTRNRNPLDAVGGINNAGQLVETYSGRTGTHNFIDTDGHLRNIDTPSTAIEAQATGINDRDQVIGIYLDGGGETSFLDSHGKFTTITDLLAGPIGTVANGINDQDQVVGTYYDASGAMFGFSERDGRFTTITVPWAADTLVEGINNAGEIVGSYYDANYKHESGFVDIDGQFTKIDFPGATNTEVLGVNDEGQIVGGYRVGGITYHGFVASPSFEPPIPPPIHTPEPLGIAVFGMGLLGIAMGRKVS